MSEPFHITGMTCRACEVRIQRALLRVPGVHAATADAASGTVRITANPPVRREAIAAAVAAAGDDYRLTAPAARPWLSRDKAVWRDLAVSVGLVALLVVLAQSTGLTSLSDRVGPAAASGSLAVVVLLGLAAGFSTCMALVGGLVLAFSARAPMSDTARPVGGRVSPEPPAWRSQVAFNVGRVLGFAALGALTGLAGTVVTLSGAALALAMLAVAAVMTLLGIRLSGASPRLSAGLVPTLPDVLSARLEQHAAWSSGRRARLSGAMAVGAATYFLPCGFTQAVQLYALSTGSAARGGAIMAAFALGTAPGLLAVGGLGATFRGLWATRFARFAAVAVLAFAVVNATGALALLAPGASPGTDQPATSLSANVRLADDAQYVATTQVADGYEPARAVVYADVPVIWQVTSEALTCASWIHAPDLGIPPGTALTPGETTEFRFTPAEPGTLTYTCGMGMYTGTIEVIERPA